MEIHMQLVINGKYEKLDTNKQEVSVIELLKLKEVKMPEMVSVQLNGDILLRKAFDSTYVHENDEVNFLYFMGGGA